MGTIINQVDWGGESRSEFSCCLICLDRVNEKEQDGHLNSSSGALFGKVSELLKVPFGDIRGEWEFGDGNGPLFCATCLKAVQAVIGLQEELEVLQRKIAVSVENIRKKIRQTSGGNFIASRTPTPGGFLQRVHNFRSKALLATSPHKNSHTAVGGKGNPPGFPSSTFSSGGSSQVPQSWLPPPAPHPSQHHQQLYNSTTDFSSAISSQQQQQLINLSTSPPQSASTHSEILAPYPSINFTVTHSGCRLNTTGDGATTSVIGGGGVLNESVPPTSPSNDDCYDPTDEHHSMSLEETSDNHNSEIPAKRPRKSRKQSPIVKSSEKVPSTKEKISSASSSPKKQRCQGSRQSEYFAPIETDSEGKMSFEGIAITPNPNGGYLCGLCSATCGKAHDSISIRKIKIHIKGFHLGAYKCQLCDKNFTSNDILSQHTTRTHEVGDKPCDICQKPIRPRYMLLHKYTHMNAEEKAALVATGFKPPISSFEKEKKFPCPRCGTMFKKMTNLRIHERTHMDEKTRPRHKCEHCEKSYTNTQSLKEHTLRVHLNGTIVKAELRRRETCEVCGKSVFARILARHMKTHVATENRPYACKVCAKRFQDEKILRNHEDKFHKEGETPDQLPFQCDICGKRSATGKQMRAHRRRVHKHNWKAKVPATLVEDVTVDDPRDDFMLLEDLNNEGLQHVEKNIFSFHLYQVEKLKGPCAGFKCCTCFKEMFGEGEELEDAVKAHVRQEHVGNFRCNVCTKRMKNLTEVIAHNKTEHLHLDSYNCAICFKPGIPRKSVRGHQFSHKGVYEAAEAINEGILLPTHGTVSQGYKRLEEREIILKSLGEPLCYKCMLCKETFDKLVGLDEHRRIKHQDKSKMATSRKGEVCSKSRSTEGNCGKRRGPPRKSKTKRRLEEEDEGADRKYNWKQRQTEIMKVEVTSYEDTDEHELVDEDGSDSDPEFRFKTKVGVTESRRLSQRIRKCPRRLSWLNDDEDGEKEIVRKRDETQTRKPADTMAEVDGSVRVKTEVNDDNEDSRDNDNDSNLKSEKDIKTSPHSSDTQGDNSDCEPDAES